MSSARIQRLGSNSATGANGLPSMDPKFQLPPVDKALVDHLRGIFPVKLGKENDLRAYDIMLGQQMVIEHLAALYEDQTKGTF